MIKTYNNVLDEKIIKDVIEYFRSITDKNVWSSNIGWEQNLCPISSNILTHTIFDKNIVKQIKSSIENKIHINFDSIDLSFIASIYVWSCGSYITWHSDTEYPYNGTIYLNKEWDTNNGGVFLYKENNTNEIKGIEPSYNSMIVNSGTEEDPHNSHCVTCIVPGTIKKRITLQWRTNPKKKRQLSYQ
jgi:hypothetical protein